MPPCYAEVMEVSIRELRNRTKQVIDLLELGQEITLTRHGRPIGRLSPMDSPDTPAARVLRMADELTASIEQTSSGSARTSTDTGLLEEHLIGRHQERGPDAEREANRKAALLGEQR